MTTTQNMSTITELLRSRDLAIKKVSKESTKFMAYATVNGSAKVPEELAQAQGAFQCVLDHLKNIMTSTSVLRKANMSILTDMPNFFTKEQMTIAECRQNIVGDKNVGLPSFSYHLTDLYNHMLKQTQDVSSAVKRHNDSAKSSLKTMLDSEYNKHESERKLSRDQNFALALDFDSAYELKVKSLTDAFWAKNKALQVDPLNVFAKMTELSEWLNDYERTKEMRINKANNSLLISVQQTYSVAVDSNTVSLEELANLIKDKNMEIQTAIFRLVVVSWKVGDADVKNLVVNSASFDYALLLTMIQAYGEMQRVMRVVTTLTDTGITNSLTKSDMTAVDIVDYKNIVVPVLTKMLEVAERQKHTATSTVKSQESSVRSEVVKLLENGMSSASARPTGDKMKEYTTSLVESLAPRVAVAPNLDSSIKQFQDLLDEYNGKIKSSLATVNANTRVQVTWLVGGFVQPPSSWDNVDKMESLVQLDCTDPHNIVGFDESDDDAPAVAISGGWNSSVSSSGGRGGRGRSGRGGFGRGSNGRL